MTGLGTLPLEKRHLRRIKQPWNRTNADIDMDVDTDHHQDH